MLLKADTPVATVVGKTWDLHVREALRIPLEENLEILNDTIAFLKKHVDEVIFDAEHFFDGYLQQSRIRARTACAPSTTPASTHLPVRYQRRPAAA